MKHPEINDPKFDNLINKLKRMGDVAVAFSGGVDSAFLLAAAGIALGEKAVGITIDSPALPRYELDDTQKIASFLGVKHVILKSDEIEEEVAANPVNRCYYCKRIEFARIRDEADRLGIRYVLDGSNADDVTDYRPGTKAKEEAQVLSPLLEDGLTKEEIRRFSKALNLPIWDKPAYACLFSRIPYGQKINKDDLQKVEKAERFFIDRGFRTVRVRCHNDLARIEVAPSDIAGLLQEPLRTEIVQALKFFGFHFVTIDLQGYRMGSFNETIGKETCCPVESQKVFKPL